eukprot:9862704-Ditylum_brightwellii.AAC.1
MEQCCLMVLTMVLTVLRSTSYISHKLLTVASNEDDDVHDGNVDGDDDGADNGVTLLVGSNIE